MSSRPLFGVVAAARLDITAGSSSYAAYFALVAQYQFGTPVIFNRAPEELAVAIGVPFFSAIGDPGLVTSTPGVVVVSFPYPTPSVVVAGTPYAVSTAVAGGTLVGVNYVDANGVLWPDVDWQWQISVEAYQNSATGDLGKFESQVVTWTGDGTANRLIPTTFPLDTGVVAIWGCGGAEASGSTEVNFYRHNGMPGTALMAINNDPISTQGIMSFVAGGFTVTAGSFVVPFANTVGVLYAAVILRDTTVDNRYMRVGTYWRPAASFVVSCDLGQTSCGLLSGSFDPQFDGFTITDGIGQYTFHYVNAVVCTISPAYGRVSGGVVGFSLVDLGSPYNVLTPSLGASVGSYTPTHVWVWGIGVTYKSPEFPGLYSVTLQDGANAYMPTDSMVTGFGNILGVGYFTVVASTIGANVSVFTVNKHYYYLTLSASAAFLATHMFGSLSGVGGVPPTISGSFGFAPGMAFSRQGGLVTNTGAGLWRGPTHTGANSTRDANVGGTNVTTNGITAIGATSISLGSEGARNGDPYYAWAFASGSLTVPADPVYRRVPHPNPPVPPKGGPVPPPGPPTPLPPFPGEQGCKIGVAGISSDAGSQACALGTASTPSI